MLKQFLYILLIKLAAMPASGQGPAAADSSFYKAASNVTDMYYQALGEQSPLYNGSEYLDYPGILVGHPFFETTSFEKGTIHFDGMVFENVPMLYDLIHDQVVILHFGKFYRINLPIEKTGEFAILGHTFIHLFPDSTNKLKAGFYDRLYSGKITLLAKREKVVNEVHDNMTITNVVLQQDIFYIKRDGVYYPVKNMNKLLDVLGSKRTEIRQYFRKNDIKFKRDREHALIMAVTYYDQLTN